MPSEGLALQALLPSLRTGDLLLFRSERFSAKFLQHALKAQYTHLAVVIIFPGLQAQPLLLEADPGTGLMRNWSLATRAHLHLIDFCSRLLGWQEEGRGNQAVIRRLEFADDMPQMHEDAVLQLLVDSTCIDPSFKLGSVEPVNQTHVLLEALYGSELVHQLSVQNGADGLSSLRCAEAAALVYRALGLLPHWVEASTLTLRDFSETSLPFKEGISLGIPSAIAKE